MNTLFCCPICRKPLTPQKNSLVCPDRHCFDRSAEGYYHLLPAHKMRAKIPGDNKEMVAARRQFLQADYYRLFSDGINATALRLLAKRHCPVILDAGCGEGYYTKRLGIALREKGIAPQMNGFDISKFAVKAAAKQDPDTCYAVAGIFDIPVADQQVDLLVNIFAPIVPNEFARVVRKDGFLLIAVPSKRHLFGMKQVLYDNPYENEQINTEYPQFAFIERISISGDLTLTDPKQIEHLFSMTPYYWKTSPEGVARLRQQQTLTTEIGFDLLIYQKT